MSEDGRTTIIRRLVRALVAHRARGHESDADLPVRAAAAAIEAVTPALAQKYEEEPRPACKEGCSYCCHLHVAVTVPEVLLAVDHARRTRDEAGMSALAEKAKRAAEAVRGTTPLSRPMQACALLGEDGKCSVYPARPLACREHHSFDVEACRLVYETRIDRKVPKRESILLLGAGGALGLRDGLGDLGLEKGTYELNQALDVALSDREAAGRWRRGEDAFGGAKAVLSEEDAASMRG